jgi:lipopolysaccharide/colanic/teichoic acid biosynthesis glycosyltransferase
VEHNFGWLKAARMQLAINRGMTAPIQTRSWTAASALRAKARRTTDLRRSSTDAQLRILNVAVAAVGIVITAPVMLVIAVAVKLTSPGPVIYKQTRVGVNRRGTRTPDATIRRAHNIGGKPFSIYKFRTMRNDSGAAQVWATKNDARVTTVGRMMRKYRLDELPQLFNVLRGEMNVVGPRPEQPKLFEDLRQMIDHYPSRQQVLPGITGWAQVNLAYDSSVDDVRKKLDCDLEYIRRRSTTEDLKIMARTPLVMLGKRLGW